MPTKSWNCRGEDSRVRVVFLTATLPQYRVPFHESVRNCLASHGIEYDIVFGQPSSEQAQKGDLASLSWGKKVINHYISVGRVSLLWQPVLRDIWGWTLL